MHLTTNELLSRLAEKGAEGMDLGRACRAIQKDLANEDNTREAERERERADVPDPNADRPNPDPTRFTRA